MRNYITRNDWHSNETKFMRKQVLIKDYWGEVKSYITIWFLCFTKSLCSSNTCFERFRNTYRVKQRNQLFLLLISYNMFHQEPKVYSNNTIIGKKLKVTKALDFFVSRTSLFKWHELWNVSYFVKHKNKVLLFLTFYMFSQEPTIPSINTIEKLWYMKWFIFQRKTLINDY